MLNVAVLGAGGFIGSRTIEMFHLTGLGQVRPVVHSVKGMAALSKFDLDVRCADVLDAAALTGAVSGVDVVISLVVGDSKTIIDSIAPIYRACQWQNVKRLIYLSSAVVHGMVPAHGTSENSPLVTGQPLPYPNAKVEAEKRLLKIRETGSVEVVILRPAIVFGPRSRFIADTAGNLLSGKACLVDQGRGICNSVYADNLIQAIYLTATQPSNNVDRQAFFIQDQEEITWADFFRPIAEALRIEFSSIPSVDADVSPSSKPGIRNHLVEAVLSSQAIETVKAMTPTTLKRAVKAAIKSFLEPPNLSPWTLPALSHSPPKPTFEMALLQKSSYRLPDEKARTILGYKPTVSFTEGMARSIAWLKFMGYPL